MFGSRLNKKAVIALVYVSFLFGLIPKPASAAVPLVIAGTLGKVSAVQGFRQAVGAAAYGLVEGGSLGAALKGAGIFAGASAAAFGVIGVYNETSQTPVSDGTVVANVDTDQIDSGGARKLALIFYAGNQVGDGVCMVEYRTSANIKIGGSQNPTDIPEGTSISSIVNSGDSINFSSVTCAGTTSTPAGSTFPENPSVEQLFLTPSASSPTGYVDSQNRPIVPLSPTEVSDFSIDTDSPVSYEQLVSDMWDSLDNKPAAYDGMTAAQALEHANTLSGNTHDSLEDYDVLPVASNPSNDTTVDDTPIEGDVDLSSVENAIDSLNTNIQTFFRSALSTQTGELIQNDNSNTDLLVSAVGSQTAVIEGKFDEQNSLLVAQNQKLDVQTEKLAAIQLSISGVPDGSPDMPPPDDVDNFFTTLDSNSDAADSQASQVISDRTFNVDFDGFSHDLVDVNGASSRVFTVSVLGTQHEIDLEPAFQLAALGSVFIYITSTLVGFRIVARAW